MKAGYPVHQRWPFDEQLNDQPFSVRRKGEALSPFLLLFMMSPQKKLCENQVIQFQITHQK